MGECCRFTLEVENGQIEAEIDCMRKSCAAVMHAFSTVFPNLRPGLTQRQVVQMLQIAICEGGAEPGFLIPAFDSESYEAQGSLPSDKHIRDGDLIWVDLGATYQGYWSDFCRAVSLGPLSKETARLGSGTSCDDGWCRSCGTR
jgi:Xaa-Pro dipeptidase